MRPTPSSQTSVFPNTAPPGPYPLPGTHRNYSCMSESCFLQRDQCRSLCPRQPNPQGRQSRPHRLSQPFSETLNQVLHTRKGSAL
jgi:hypothetical protein